MRYITRSCPAPVHVVVDADLLDLLLRAGSLAGRGANRLAIETSRASDTAARSLIVHRVRRRSRMDNADWLRPIWAAKVSWRTPRGAIQARTSAATLRLSSSTAVSPTARR